jgi:hypothetical protein
VHSYAIFTGKRGRPKSTPIVTSYKPSNLDVITSLFYLKKLNQGQVSAAHYYVRLYRDYYRYIGAPNDYSDYIIDLTRSHSANNNILDQNIEAEWYKVKSTINKISSESEGIMYKVIIENKMKDELLNPISMSKNPLKTLQLSLDAVNKLL